MKNGVKNGISTRFSKLYQPSSNSKSEGWERRKQRQEFMDKVIKLQNISVSDFNRLRREINAKDSKYSISDLIAFKYASKVLKSDKFLLGFYKEPNSLLFLNAIPEPVFKYFSKRNATSLSESAK